MLAGEDLDGARIAFGDILKHSPNDYTARTNLAHIQQVEGQYDDAHANYQRAIEWFPNQPAAYFGLALLLETTGQSQRAIETMRAAVRFAPPRDRKNARQELERMESKRPLAPR